MKKNLNIYILGLIALGFLALAFSFELVIHKENIRNIFAIISGSMIVGIVFYVVVVKMIFKK